MKSSLATNKKKGVDIEVMHEMAIEIDNFLRENKKKIVDLVQEKGKAENIRGGTFEQVVSDLMTAFPLGQEGKPWRDKAHEELAIAIIHSM